MNRRRLITIVLGILCLAGATLAACGAARDNAQLWIIPVILVPTGLLLITFKKI